MQENDERRSLENRIAELTRQINQLQISIAQLTNRVWRLENPSAEAQAPITESTQTQQPPTAAVEAASSAQPSGGQTFDDKIAAIKWEGLIGGNWLARVGIVAFVLGVGFFLKLSFDNQWIGETGRVVLGIVTGVVLIAAGEYWQSKYPILAQALIGGSIAVLFLSIFAAFALYELIGNLPALGFMSLVTVTAGALAIRHRSASIATLGILGGFATPFLLYDNPPDDKVLLAYLLVLDLGVLFLATFRNWPAFNLLALLGSLSAYTAWAVEFGEYDVDLVENDLLLAEGSLTLFFLIFLGASSLFHIIWKRAPKAADLTLFSINAFSYLAYSLALMSDEYGEWMGAFALSLALLYGAFGFVVLYRGKELVRLSYLSVGVAAVMLTVAIPIQLEGSWVTIGWSAQAAVLLWLSFNLKITTQRIYSFLLYALTATALVIKDGTTRRDFTYLASYNTILNERVLSFSVTIVAMYLAIYLIRKYKAQLTDDELEINTIMFVLTANFLTLWMLSAEVMDSVNAHLSELSEGSRRSAWSLGLTLLWTFYSAIALGIGVVKRLRWIRLGGLSLLGISLLKLFLVDAFALEPGYRVVAFLVLGLLLLAGGYIYQRNSKAIKGFLFD